MKKGSPKLHKFTANIKGAWGCSRSQTPHTKKSRRLIHINSIGKLFFLLVDVCQVRCQVQVALIQLFDARAKWTHPPPNGCFVNCNSSFVDCIHALCLFKTKQETQIGNISCKGLIFSFKSCLCWLPGERSSRGDLASLVMIIARLRPTA